MKRITIDINDQEYLALVEKAEFYNTDVKTLLGAFVQDLTASDRSGGSDERMKANEWASRSLRYR